MNGQSLNPLALPLPEAARMLAKLLKKPVTVEMLQADIDEGAPLNDDDSVNVVHHMAWLIREMAKAE